MKLYYGLNSPYSRKVRVVLAERGIDFEPNLVDLEQPPADFARANPNLRIPCLVDGERALFESNVIVEYLLQRPGAWPAGNQPPLARSLIRPEHAWDDQLVLHTIETLLDSGLNAFGLLRDGVTPEQSLTLRRELRRMASELDWLEAQVGPEEGFVPGVLSIQDLNLVIALQWMDFRKPAPWRGRPHLEALVARYEARSSLRTTLPGT